jgi:hypothetical protein
VDSPPRVARAPRRRWLRGLLLLCAVGVAGAGALAWRPSRGALELRVLVPILERALSRPTLGVTAAVGATELVWDAAVHRPVLRARDVRFAGARGETLARLAEVAIRPSGGALLRGVRAEHDRARGSAPPRRPHGGRRRLRRRGRRETGVLPACSPVRK